MFAGFVARKEDTRLTTEVRDVRRNNGGGRGLCRRPGKKTYEVFPGRSQSFRHQRRPVDDCSPGRGTMGQNTAEQGAEHFMAKWIVAEKAMAIAQSKRARADGSLALVD